MLKADIDGKKGKNNVHAQGELTDITAEVLMLINTVYFDLKSHGILGGPAIAEMFRMMVTQSLILQDSPVFQEQMSKGGTIIVGVVPREKHDDP